MEHFVEDSEFAALYGKTILIIGAASGIGKAAVELAHRNGARLAVGDWNATAGKDLAEQLGERVIFRQCDVSKWEDVVAFFEAAWKAFGAIDVVIANAGIHTEGEWIEDAIKTPEGGLQPPDMQTTRVNLEGPIYVAKCALHYFARQPERRTQLVFTGSAASFLDTPPLHQYCASKYGVLGLMRSLRHTLPKISKTTVNMVAPWHTGRTIAVHPPPVTSWTVRSYIMAPNHTAMTTERFRQMWGNLPSNSTTGVARALLLPVIRPNLHGRTLFVHGDRMTDIEAGQEACLPLIFGDEVVEHVREGQRRILS